MEHPYPEMVAIWKANREHCTAAAIIEDGEVISGSMPGDDYKLAWISADGWMRARTVLVEQNRQSVLKTPKSWVKQLR